MPLRDVLNGWSVLNEVLEYVASLNRRQDPVQGSQEVSDVEMLRASIEVYCFYSVQVQGVHGL